MTALARPEHYPSGVLSTVTRAVLPALSLRLAPAVLLLWFGFTQVDAVVDWPQLGADLRARPLWQQAVGVSSWVFLWTAAASRALSTILDSRLPWLWRQPVSDKKLGGLLAFPMGLAAVPAALPALLLGPSAAAVTLVGAAVGLASRHTLRGLAWAGATGVAAVVAAAFPLPSLFLLPALALAALPAAGRRARSGRTHGSAPPRARMPRPRGRWTALLHRDGLALARKAPTVLFFCLLDAVPAYAAQRAVHQHNDLSALTLAWVALLVVGLAAVLAVAALVVVGTALEDQLDPPSWPIAPYERVATLALGTTLLLTPTTVAVVLASPHPQVLLLAITGTAALVAGAVWLVVRAPTPQLRGHAQGRWLWWAMGVVAIGRFPGAPLIHTLMAGCALTAATHALRRHRRART
jgi:hypothetical protein